MERSKADIQTLTSSCISKFERLLAQSQGGFERLDNRLADFSLWADGIGALAMPGASLDTRLKGRDNDLALVKNVLLMLVDSLDYLMSLSEVDLNFEGGIQNLDSIIKNLALIGVAIRRTGKASRNRRTDKSFDQDDQQDFRKHLECVALIRPTKEAQFRLRDGGGYTTRLEASKPSELQNRLITANLRRRHAFLLAQKRSILQTAPWRQTSYPKVIPSAEVATQTASSVKKGTQAAESLISMPIPLVKKRITAPTISGLTQASTAEGSLQYNSVAKKYTPGVAQTQITVIASDAEFPQPPSADPGREIAKCPCCCQSLPTETFVSPKLWKQHIVEDLCPYTCIAENCPTPELLFSTRHEWERHVKDSHLPQWECPFCEEQDAIHHTMESMASHLQSKHEDERSDNSLSTLLSWAAVQKMGITSCPLCSSSGPEDAPELVEHVLRHTYDFALRALPWPQPWVHDVNVAPGGFKLPSHSEQGRYLLKWINEAFHKDTEHPKLELCNYDREDHSDPSLTNASKHSEYFELNTYFGDMPEDRSSKPQASIDRISPPILSANDTTYSYNYLNDGEIRLIRLQPGRKEDFEDIVKCQIYTCSLTDPRPYVALSYAWGDVSDKRKILIVDIQISVSASLESALRTLRDTKESIWLWADALSIDQQDASEKAEQVRLMTQIYQKARSVALWLGPRSQDSDLGMELIEKVSDGAKIPREITTRTPAPFSEQNFAAVVALFERPYWHRLWVIQEVFNARDLVVYCGSTSLPWKAFQDASEAFSANKDVLDRSFPPGYSNNFYQARHGSYPQVLVYGGPGSLTGIGTVDKFRDGDNLSDHEAFQDLLNVMRTCRPKHSSEPRDKVFGILGVLQEKVRNEIKVNYSIPVKDVYTNVFRTIVEKTNSLDILCDSIHFPTYHNKNNLPSWAPDWSHLSRISPIATTYPFSASRNAKVVIDFTKRNELRISAIPLGSIKDHGVSVGTQCTLNDYLMAFLQWRACWSQAIDGEPEEYIRWLEQRFCLALSLDQTPKKYEKPEDWMDVCYYVFASLIRDRLPKLHMDHDLEQYVGKDFQMDYNKRRIFLQDHFGQNMMGRCFCITDERRVGLGTGSMTRGDIVVVPLGCSTPVVLRPEGDEYRFVGDIYMNGYMYGRAVEECNMGDKERQVRSYVIH